MGEGGLVERLDRTTTRKSGGSSPAGTLDSVAKALRDVTDSTARDLRKSLRGAPPSPGAPATNDNDPAFPQILQNSPTIPPSENAPDERSMRQVIAPVVLAVALACVAVLLMASVFDTTRIPGLGWLADAPRPKLVARTAPAPDLARAPQTSVAAPANAPVAPVPPLSLDELALLERCEKLIAAGEMQAARVELARVANEGSVNARFALAETFDPNVLAAWGLRAPVADVGAARALYEQAHAAGDPRAASRIAALRDGE